MTIRPPGWAFWIQWPIACWLGLQLVPDRYVFLSTRLTFAVAFAVVSAVSVLGHELAHAAIGSMTTGQPTTVRVFGPLFGGATIDDPITGDPIDAWTVRAVVAGPAFNLAVAASAWFVLEEMPTAAPIQAIDLVVIVFVVNFALGVFNLLPVEPLDGGRILSLLARRGSGRTRMMRVRFVQGLSLGLVWTVFFGLLIETIRQARGPLDLTRVIFWALIAFVATAIVHSERDHWAFGIIPALAGVAVGYALAHELVLPSIR